MPIQTMLSPLPSSQYLFARSNSFSSAKPSGADGSSKTMQHAKTDSLKHTRQCYNILVNRPCPEGDSYSFALTPPVQLHAMRINCTYKTTQILQKLEQTLQKIEMIEKILEQQMLLQHCQMLHQQNQIMHLLQKKVDQIDNKQHQIEIIKVNILYL